MLTHVAFHQVNGVGIRDVISFAAQWLAYMLPCRRFVDTLAGAYARLGADVDRYSFIAVDFHHLLLASLPAHSLQIPPVRISQTPPPARQDRKWIC
ncbi:MAG: hypothetical protein E5X77_27315 [Mesorhizobium sp.]|nr:MAG: hypothetical protein E5X77_27315 [Mesorhizobium sp.]